MLNQKSSNLEQENNVKLTNNGKYIVKVRFCKMVVVHVFT